MHVTGTSIFWMVIVRFCQTFSSIDSFEIILYCFGNHAYDRLSEDVTCSILPFLYRMFLPQCMDVF